MKDDAPLSDGDLAVRAQQGDKLAFESLVHRHKSSLFRFVRRSTGNDDDAYDVVQDSFVSAWLALHRFDQRKSFAVWLRAIALNKCRDHGRRKSVRQRFLRFLLPRDGEISAGDDHALEQDQERLETVRLAALDRAIADLPAFYKEPLLLTTVSGLSQQQAAEQLKTTTKAVEMRVRRAKKKLTEALGPLKTDDA